MTGRISIVGAGPGDPDLITRKGIDRLKSAEIVFHDKLSPNALLERYCSPEADIRDVGKRKGKVGPDQDEINRQLVEATRRYDRVVRLKGGDPFLFGRGGEETEYLADRGIEFEIIPGVSSLTAVPAAAGIPLTHRDHSSSVGIITGHLKPESPHTNRDWDSLARMDTLVIMMGVTRAGSLAQKLLSGGRSPDTPVAVIGWGATPKQQSMIGTLEELSEGIEEPGPYLPGLIIIGDVVTCRTTLNWFESRPLFGRRILVTRPRNQARRLSDPLREQGAQTDICPTIRVESLTDGMAELRNTLSRLRNYDWVVFTSRNGVRFTFRALRDSERDLRVLGNVQFACIGPGTRERLAQEGFDADLVPSDNYRAEELADSLLEQLSPESNLLLPRATGAREVLPERLREGGHRVDVLSIYRSRPGGEESAETLREILLGEHPDMITFTSSSTVDNFFAMVEDPQARAALDRVALACIGPVTASTLAEHGWEADLVPEQYDLESFCRAIRQYDWT